MSTRWGFLGAGWIAAKALAPAVHNAKNATLYAVASRDLKRATDLNPERVYATYEELLADPKIDAVYISLTNDVHCEWSAKALNAGKHVLCEKPLAMDSFQVQLMADAAITKDRLLVEAVWTRWHPRFVRMVDLVSEVGDLISIDTAFTFPGSLAGNYRLDPTKGGGSLFDVGPYLAHAVVAITDEQHDLQIISLSRNMSSTGVDLTTSFEVLLKNKLKVTGLTSFEKPETQNLKITGSQTTIEFLGNDAFTSWNSPSSLRIGDRIENFAPVDPYQLMVENFSARINGEESWLLPIAQSMQAMSILDQLRLAPQK